jgi:4-hydroxythreonine-4-phosphate dehydrogenase
MIAGLFSSTSPPLSRPIAVSMGEPAGIGVECALKAWHARKQYGLQPFFLIADPQNIKEQAKRLGLNTPLREIANPEEAIGAFSKTLPILPLSLQTHSTPGKPDPTNAGPVIESIRKATGFALKGQAAAVVTLPIHKNMLYQSGFSFPGHTEFLANLCQVPETVMMLEVTGLRVALSTVHLSLKDAIAKLSVPLIVSRAMIINQSLRNYFGIEKPRIALAALNPHAGENGAMGMEEIEIIMPAIKQLRSRGIEVTDPYPADSMFHAAMRNTYDCALCHYHDQGLIPIKTLDFFGGVNITLGLPILRTSPDHGTALDIAGQNKANPSSVINALKRASQLALNA